MTQALIKPITFDEFIAWYPENTGQRYELHDGEIVEIPKPTGKYSKIAGFLAGKLFIEIERLHLPYLSPKNALLSQSKNQDMSRM